MGQARRLEKTRRDQVTSALVILISQSQEKDLTYSNITSYFRFCASPVIGTKRTGRTARR